MNFLNSQFTVQFTKQFTIVTSPKLDTSLRASEQAQLSNSNNDLPDYIKTMKIPEDQKLKLSIFPREVYLQAYKSLTTNKNPIRDAFQFLFGACRKICQERGIKPLWEKLYGKKKV